MRIIAGKARNLELNVPEGMGVRPTSGRGRKALLDSLGELEDAAVLDLFSGSGAFAGKKRFAAQFAALQL